MKHQLSLSIPFYNEEDCAKITVEELISVFNLNKVDYELILINNGSTDKTHSILLELARKNSRIKLIEFKKNQGFGGAIIEGFKKSNAKYVSFTCGDGEVSAEDTYKIYQNISKKKLDVCKAARISRKDGFLRKIYSKIFNITVRVVFNLKIRDVNGYPLIMKRDAYKKINPKISSWVFNLDLLYRIKKYSLKTEEISVFHRKRRGGVSVNFELSQLSKFYKIFTMLWDILSYRIYGK